MRYNVADRQKTFSIIQDVHWEIDKLKLLMFFSISFVKKFARGDIEHCSGVDEAVFVFRQWTWSENMFPFPSSQRESIWDSG